jgi:hypothetical protein
VNYNNHTGTQKGTKNIKVKWKINKLSVAKNITGSYMKFSRGFLIAKGFYRYIVERKSIKESFASKKTVLKKEISKVIL